MARTRNTRTTFGTTSAPTTGTGSSSIVTGVNTAIPVSAPKENPSPVLLQNAQVVSDTTTVDKTVGDVITGVSIIPYMRYLAIDFLGYRLRPNRQVWFYFDDKSVDRLIQRPNIIELTSNVRVADATSGVKGEIQIGSFKARILHTERDLVKGNVRIYASEFNSANATANVGNTLTVVGTDYSSVVSNYEHFSGFLRANSTNSAIKLSLDASSASDDYYIGNTISIVNGTKAGQSAEIIGYIANTRTALVEPAFEINPKETDLIYTIGDYRSWYSSNVYPTSYVASRGKVSGVFHVPDPNKNPDAKFTTGDRIFRILDNPRNDITSYTTRADYRFTANGLDLGTAQIIERDTDFDFPIFPPVTPPPSATRTPTPTRTLSPGVTPSVTKSPVPPASPSKSPTPSASKIRLPSNCGFASGRANPENLSGSTRPFAGDATLLTSALTHIAYVSDLSSASSVIAGSPNQNLFASIPQVPPFWRLGGVTMSTPAGTKFTTPTASNGSGRTYVRVWYQNESGGSSSQAADVTGQYVWDILARMVDAEGCYVPPPPPGGGGGGIQTEGNHNGAYDPIAQTFYVSTVEHPSGVFISSVDLFFRNKGETLPVEVQIRPVVNGVPDSAYIIPGATTTLDIEDIKVSNFPDAANSSTNTRFTFSSPVYLNSGFEYALVVLTDDYGYDYYSAELGQKILGTDRIISKQPFMGSLFKSQNSTTWTPIQDEDMMFVLNRSEFTVPKGTLYLEEDKRALLRELSSNNAYNSFDDIKANTYYDSYELRSDAIELNSTKLDYLFKGVSNSTKTMASAYSSFKPDNRFDLEERNMVINPQLEEKSLDIRVDLSTARKDVSPIVFHNRQNMVTIENLINDTGLTPERFTIVNPGSGYDATNAYVTITSNVGYGANAWAVANATTGNIVSIYVDSPGVGYVDDVTITIGGGTGTGAVVNVSTETGTSGGPAIARYISKTVTLLDGFDAGDLRIFMTAVKPPGSNVNVYYKVRNALDPDRIEEKNWVRMVQKTSQYSFSTNRNPVEYEYRPSLTSNNITYSTDTTTYKTFNQFAIKIVLSAPSTVANSIPYVLDVRAIALPEDAY